MFHLIVRHLLLQQQINSLTDFWCKDGVDLLYHLVSYEGILNQLLCCLKKVTVDFKTNLEIYSKINCGYLQLWCCYFNCCVLNSVHYYRREKFDRMTEWCISVSIYKATTVLYGCDSCGDCVTVFALFLFASTLDHKLINRSNSLSVSCTFPGFCMCQWVSAGRFLTLSLLCTGRSSPPSIPRLTLPTCNNSGTSVCPRDTGSDSPSHTWTSKLLQAAITTPWQSEPHFTYDRKQ